MEILIHFIMSQQTKGITKKENARDTSVTVSGERSVHLPCMIMSHTHRKYDMNASFVDPFLHQPATSLKIAPKSNSGVNEEWMERRS